MGAYDDVNMDEGDLGNAEAGDQGEQQQADTGLSGQQQQQQQPEQVWDGTKFNLVYRGQPYTPKSHDELINLAQKGFSYTQELERFNKFRRETEEQMRGLQGRYKQYDEFDQMLKTNPAFAERMMALAQEFQSGQGQQQGAASQGNAGNGYNYQMYNGLVGRLQKLEQMYEGNINAEADRKLNSDIEKLKSTYPNHQWDFDDGTGSLVTKVLQFAYDHGINNVEHAYRVMMWDQVGSNSKGAALKQAADARQAASRAGIVSKGSPAPRQQPAGYKYGMSYQDLATKMASEMKG